MTVNELPFAIDEQRPRSRPGALQHLLLAVPRPDGQAATAWWCGAGIAQPPSFHIDRLLQADAGYFFDVMTNGFGVMPDYKAQIAPRDRWAIVAYVRALQLSQHAAASDIEGGDPTKPPATRRWRARAREALRMETHAVNTDVPALARLQQRALVVGFWGLVAGGIGGVFCARASSSGRGSSASSSASGCRWDRSRS